MPVATGDGGIVFKARPGWHRDTLENEQVVRILAPGNENAAATFVTDTSYKVGNTQKVGRGNPQATRVVGEGQFIPVSVKDGARLPFDCPASVCTETPWPVVTGERGQRRDVRAGVQGPDPDRRPEGAGRPRSSGVIVYHVLDNGKVERSRSCARTGATGGEPECRTARITASGNLVIKVYTYKNGGYKGALAGRASGGRRRVQGGEPLADPAARYAVGLLVVHRERLVQPRGGLAAWPSRPGSRRP